MSKDIRTQLAKEILDFKWPVPTTDVMRGWNLALDSLVEYKLTNDIAKVVYCKNCKWKYDEGCIHMLGMLRPNDDDYCSYGERKDG